MKYFKLVLLIYFAQLCSQISGEYGSVKKRDKEPNSPSTHEATPIGRQKTPSHSSSPEGPTPARRNADKSEELSQIEYDSEPDYGETEPPDSPEEVRPTVTWAELETGTPTDSPEVTTVGMATSTVQEQSDFTEFDIKKHLNSSGELSEKEMQDLTEAAFASLSNTTEDIDDENALYSNTYWSDMSQKMYMGMEWMRGIKHVGSYDEKVKACYFIGVTYKNAATDIRKYYKIRHLYAKNKVYEVGYLVEEIICHYQIAVELYHLMVRKYGANRYRFYAPTTYMLYIYTNILHQCKTILHLCNMLHEVKAKYAGKEDSLFEDYNNTKETFPKSPDDGGEARQQMRIAEERKRKMKELKKRRKKLFKSGFFLSTTIDRRPKKGPFPLHYGWSVEDW